MIAAKGPVAAELAAEIGDGFIHTVREKGAIRTVAQDAGGG